MVDMRIIHVVFTDRNYGVALYKYVILFQFDSTFYQYTFWHIFGHGNGYKISHNMIGPVAQLHYPMRQSFAQ